jgi:hypothetical protein
MKTTTRLTLKKMRWRKEVPVMIVEEVALEVVVGVVVRDR